MIPAAAVAAADVYKAGRPAAKMWRVGEEVTFAYLEGYDGARIASTLPLGRRVVLDRLRTPPYFAGLLPEGDTRRRSFARALHIAEDDELGLLLRLGADTIGDVQVVAEGARLPDPDEVAPVDLSQLRFEDLWLPEDVGQRSSIAGVQPKISYHSRSLIGGRAGRVILKLSPDASWHGVLRNEWLFMSAAPTAGVAAPHVEIVTDAAGTKALAVERFDRSLDGATLLRHAQEDASQLLGLRPSEKYDPDARQVIGALSEACSAPLVARRDLLHQLLYSYAVGNNDLHAKNLSIGQDPRSGVWSVTPAYDVLHTWPYEGDHRFHPAVRDVVHDSVTRRHWLALGADLALPAKVIAQLCDRVAVAVGRLVDTFSPELLDMPETLVRDVRRRVSRRVRDLDD